MTIQVKENDDNSLMISWNKDDPQECILNEWTEQDFIDAIIQEANNKLGLHNDSQNNSSDV